MDVEKMQLIATAHHRNGIGGDPFRVALFKDEEDRVMVSVDFGGASFAVLQVSKLSKGDIAFGSNSWRGDNYKGPVRKLVEGADDSVAEGALYVEWPLKE